MTKPTTLTLRRFRDEDATALADIRAEAAVEAGIGNESTLGTPPTADELRASGNNADENSFVIAEVDDQVVGYSTMTHWSEASGVTVFLIDGYVAAKFRNQGVATEVLHHMESQAETRAKSMGVQDDAVFGAGASTSEDSRKSFLHDNGYSVVFSMVEMELLDLSSIAPTSSAADLELGTATADECRQLWELDELVYQGRPFTPATSVDSLERFTERAKRDLSLWFVARDQGGVVACASSCDRDTYAEITDVSVHPDYRRRGFGKALLTRNLVELSNRGFKRARLHTDGENRSGALSLYESIGFQLRERRLRFRKGMDNTTRLY